MNPCEPVQQQAVQDRLEALYEADGRHDPDHPMHSTYTGLAQAASTDEPAVPEGREPAAVTGQPNWRGLCAELVDAWLKGDDIVSAMNRARAALAEADEPAVPEGREPAAVISEPSDAELLCIAAEAIDGYGNGINPGDYEPATECAVEAYGSELCAYARAVLARWGNLKGSLTSSPPADGEVAPDSCNRGLLPMIVSATGDPNEPELERIICSSISGGADYLNGMPRELSLQRITAEGSVFARYIQGPRSPELTLNSTNDTFRALCAELLRGLDENRHPEVRYPGHLRQIMASARAALTDEPAVPAPPADGEVADRAAELLQRQVLVPVSVSERLPGPEDCDAEGMCWWGTPSFANNYIVTQSAQWRLCAPDDRFGSELLWLPAHALPLPEVSE